MRQSDEFASLRRFISQATPSIVIDNQRPTGTWSRPRFYIQNPDHIVGEGTGQWSYDRRIWNVRYFAKTYDDASINGLSWINKLRAQKQKLRIPLYLFKYPYTMPILRAKANAGTFIAGTYNVAIVAEDDNGKITSISPSASIALALNDGLEVQVPLEPRGWPIGYRYHIYLGGTPTSPTALHRVGSVIYPFHTKLDPTVLLTADVPSGTAQGQAPALASTIPANTEVRYRYMSVDESSIAISLAEDEQEAGLWDAIVSLRTETPFIREYDHSQSVGEVNLDLTSV